MLPKTSRFHLVQASESWKRWGQRGVSLFQFSCMHSMNLSWVSQAAWNLKGLRVCCKGTKPKGEMRIGQWSDWSWSRWCTPASSKRSLHSWLHKPWSNLAHFLVLGLRPLLQVNCGPVKPRSIRAFASIQFPKLSTPSYEVITAVSSLLHWLGFIEVTHHKPRLWMLWEIIHLMPKRLPCGFMGASINSGENPFGEVSDCDFHGDKLRSELIIQTCTDWALQKIQVPPLNPWASTLNWPSKPIFVHTSSAWRPLIFVSTSATILGSYLCISSLRVLRKLVFPAPCTFQIMSEMLFFGIKWVFISLD